MELVSEIRRFRDGDEEPLRKIFFETIRAINRRDYTEEQVRAWAPEQYDKHHWRERIRNLNPFICEIDGTIAGYADLQPTGYVDHFYVNKDFQRQGVGATLMDRIHSEAAALKLRELTADVSITARPFFEHFGFKVVASQNVTINDVVLQNFRMRHTLS